MRPQRGGTMPKFDLSECLLESPPEPLPLDFIEPPNWAIGAVARFGGRRLPKFVRQEPSWGGHYTAAGYSKPWYGCADYGEVDTTGTVRPKAKKSHAPKVAPHKQTELGNLPNEEYRFWRGFANMPGTVEATCRWCARAFYGPEQRRDHHAEKHCNSKLLKVFKMMMRSVPKVCVACKKRTHYARWGVPICNDVGCISRWKFSPLHMMDGWIDAKNFALTAGYLDGFPDEVHNNSRGTQ